MKPITLLFLFLSTILFAQEIMVFNLETGKPIKNVAVFNVDKSIAFVTNELGKVSITDFKSNEHIYFSHVSYAESSQKKKEIIQNGNQVFLSKQSEQLDEVVLSVFKKQAKTNKIAKQIAVLSKQDIQKISPQTSADVLSNIAGIKVQKSQFGGGSPILRGMESNRVLLVVDGVRLNNAIYRKGHLQNSITVSPNLLERTEVVFGPTSVTYGSDALGGVIHYYTKTPKLSNKFTVKPSLFSRYSSANNEVTNNASVELQSKKWASFTSISHSDFEDLQIGKNRSHGFENWGKVLYYSDNFRENYTKNPIKNNDVNLQRNTGYHQTDVLQKFFVPLSNTTDLKLNFQYSTSSDIPRFDKLTELHNDKLKFAEWYYGPQKRLLVSPQLFINPNKKWMRDGVITLAYQNIKESRVQRRFGSLERSYRNENVNVYSINADFSVLTAKNRTLAYGFDMAYNDAQSSSEGKNLRVQNNTIVGFSDDFKVQTRYPDGGSSYTSSSIYADYRQSISANSSLNTGVRLTNTHLSAKWIDNTFITLPDTDIKLQNTAFTASVGYVYKPKKSWHLSAVLSSGFRSPNIDDVGKVREKNGNVTVPNINLKPEHAYNAEVGVQRYFNNRKFKVQLNGYYTLLRNYIYRDNFQLAGISTVSYDNEEGKIVANINKGNAYVTGFTASYQGKLLKNLKTSGSVTYTYGKTYDTNEPMSSIPPLFGNFNIDYSYNQLEVGTNLRFNAHKKVKDYNVFEGIDNIEQTPIVNPTAKNAIDKYYGSPSWMTIGLQSRYTFTKSIALQFQVDNLFDEHYKEFASGVSAFGRNFAVTLQANF